MLLTLCYELEQQLSLFLVELKFIEVFLEQTVAHRLECEHLLFQVLELLTRPHLLIRYELIRLVDLS